MEVLAAAAITTTVAAVSASVLFNTFTSGRSLLKQTDGYESLRLAGASMVNDARFSFRVDCGWDNLLLYKNSRGTDYVVYKFAAWDGDPDAGTPDPDHLHRWEVIDDVLQRDDIVGWNLVPPDFSGDPEATEFQCNAGSTQRWAYMRLVKAPGAGQAAGTHIEFRALLRTQ